MPPPIPELRRRLLLTRLVLHWGERRAEEPLLPGQAAALAASLARLLDRVATEGASFARIVDLVPEGLAEHWRVVHQFLEILPHHWPRILAEEEALDAASRRNRLLEQQTAAWRRSPPRHPVIAAGLIGGIPAMTELLSLVAALDQGAVILARPRPRPRRCRVVGNRRGRSSPTASHGGVAEGAGTDPGGGSRLASKPAGRYARPRLRGSL